MLQCRGAARGSVDDPAQVIAMAQSGFSSAGTLPHRVALEAGFGVDLSDVRAHTGTSAVQASQAIGAEAYTMGADIAFAHPAPSKELVAHEVAHVIQQRAGAGPASGVSAVGDPFEVEANTAAATVAAASANAERPPGP